jgi:DNA-directed RNA polymerase specialized sigma24 family protein
LIGAQLRALTRYAAAKGLSRHLAEKYFSRLVRGNPPLPHKKAKRRESLIAGDAKAVRSREEIEAAVRGFTDAEWIRLRLVAKKYAGRFHMRDDDLLQEAFRRALENDSKKCPIDVGVISFLILAMRSIADDEKDLVENRSAHVPIGPGDDGEDAGETVDPASTEFNTEECAVLAANSTEIRQAMKAIFKDDPVACDLVDGIIDDFSPDELRELTGLDKVAYASKRRFMRRTIDRHFPNGWPP